MKMIKTKPILKTGLTADGLVEQLSSTSVRAVEATLQVFLAHPAQLLDTLRHGAVQPFVIRPRWWEHHTRQAALISSHYYIL